MTLSPPLVASTTLGLGCGAIGNVGQIGVSDATLRET